jgi:hypothetical protein
MSGFAIGFSEDLKGSSSEAALTGSWIHFRLKFSFLFSLQSYLHAAMSKCIETVCFTCESCEAVPPVLMYSSSFLASAPLPPPPPLPPPLPLPSPPPLEVPLVGALAVAVAVVVAVLLPLLGKLEALVPSGLAFGVSMCLKLLEGEEEGEAAGDFRQNPVEGVCGAEIATGAEGEGVCVLVCRFGRLLCLKDCAGTEGTTDCCLSTGGGVCCT